MLRWLRCEARKKSGCCPKVVDLSNYNDRASEGYRIVNRMVPFWT